VCKRIRNTDPLKHAGSPLGRVRAPNAHARVLNVVRQFDSVRNVRTLRDWTLLTLR
jgi:hypothetical protein